MTEELVKAMEALAEAARNAGLAARVVSLPEPAAGVLPAEQPERFEHVDIDGDRVLVYPHDYPEFQSVLMVETEANTNAVRLSQEAVNRLAQYLDRYRTDMPCPLPCRGNSMREECAGTRGHDGPCSPDADMIGAPVAVREHRCGCTSDANGAPVTYPLPTGDGRCTGTYEGFRCRRLADHEGEHA